MRDRNFRAGDVLVACVNELNVPTGFLGHSAIAVNDSQIVEAVILYPLRLSPMESFLSIKRASRAKAHFPRIGSLPQ